MIFHCAFPVSYQVKVNFGYSWISEFLSDFLSLLGETDADIGEKRIKNSRGRVV